MPDEPLDLRPTMQDVAMLARTRTVGLTLGGLGGDSTTGDITVFTAETRPSAGEVDLLIDQASGAILAQIPAVFPLTFVARIKHATALYTAILIEGSFFREQLDNGSVELWRALLADLMTTMRNELAGLTGPAGFGSIRVRTVLTEDTTDWVP